MLVPKIVASLRALRDVVITPVGPPMTGMSKTAVALVCSCLWVAPCMGAATPWVLLPLGVLLPLRAPSLGAPTPWLLLSHRVLLPPAFRVRAR